MSGISNIFANTAIRQGFKEHVKDVGAYKSETLEVLANFNAKYTEMAEPVLFSMARISNEIKALQEKKPTKKLQQIIEKKQQMIQGLSDMMKQAQQSYYSIAQNIAERTQAFQGLSRVGTA